MIWRSITSLCAVAAIMALAACETTRGPGLTKTCDEGYKAGIELDLGSTPGDPQVMKQHVNHEDVGDILKDVDMLNTALDTLGAVGPNIPAKIASLRGSTLTRHLAGVSVSLFLDAADTTVPGGIFNPVADFRTKGQLQAYFYDATGVKESCLRVVMTTETKHGGSDWHIVEYRWHVFGHFQVAEKTEKNDPGYNHIDVFPESDTVPISEVMAGDFNYKLWARGDAIKVTLVERKLPSGNWLPLPNLFYQPAAGSCIDMMFEAEPPRLGEDIAVPPFYCLGRCEYPPIINTM